MKRQLITLLFAILALAAAQAQQISVVSTSGSTHLYSTLQEAIEGASSGSVIYIPGGGFPITDDVKITKKVTIIGIGHKTRNENVDGNTIIGGNLFFNQGSDGSAVMGCYISGDVNIGEDGEVDNILVKLCNLNAVKVLKPECKGTVINQNYVRGRWDTPSCSWFSGATDVTISNNILHRVCDIGSGTIKNNIQCFGGWSSYIIFQNVNNTIITGNILCNTDNRYILSGSNCQVSNNLVQGGGSWGDDPVIITDNIEQVLENVNDWAINPQSDFHFKQDYKQYESQVGIYAGTGFNDSQLPPTPYIVGKVIPDNTDAAGKLNIRVRVKASSNE